MLAHAVLARVDAHALVVARREEELAVLGEIEGVDARDVLAEHAADADVDDLRRGEWAALREMGEAAQQPRVGGDGASP